MSRIRLFIKRRKRALLIVVLLLTAGGVAALRMRRAKVAIPSPIATVTRRDLVLKVTETGIIQPTVKVDVKSKVGGKILRLAVQEGDEVKAGDLIAVLDRDEIQARYDQVAAQLRAAQARAAGADVSQRLQRSETSTAVREAQANLAAAKSRLESARKALAMQTLLSTSSVEQAKANLQAAEARLEELRAGPRPQEVAQAEETLRQAQYAEADAKRQYDRKNNLLKKGFVPAADVDAARTQWEIARSRTQSAQKQLDLVKAGPRAEEIRAAEAQVSLQRAAVAAAEAEEAQAAIRQEDARQAEAAVRQCEAALAAAKAGRLQEDIRTTDYKQAVASVAQLRSTLKELETQLSDTVVRSPGSGTVIRRYIEQGELITSGVSSFSSGMTICTVADLSQMLVIPEINEVDVAKVRVGQPVEVTVDAAPNRLFHGVVAAIAPASTQALDAAAGAGQGGVIKFRVKVRVANPDRILRPGMSANVSIITASKRGCLCLPVDAVGEKRGRKVVDLLVASTPARKASWWTRLLRRKPTPARQTFRERVIKTGLETETHVEVFGLKLNDKVRANKRTFVPRKQIDLTPREGSS